ncbi:uncharacterized protein RAG0_16426 [Rhynchosporium agropyri]|uniref:Uncharacterized protein n=1 Tax=Rhynchosporium agropyri TaxID=914238 RepID=A0A1E1LQC3_9HELO|nr:uncharacterized protein RAG0_16426 [Rhynchosporium agropyri]
MSNRNVENDPRLSHKLEKIVQDISVSGRSQKVKMQPSISPHAGAKSRRVSEGWLALGGRAHPIKVRGVNLAVTEASNKSHKNSWVQANMT